MISARNAVVGAFAELRKATVSFVMSVCPSVRLEHLGSHWTDFHEIRYDYFSKTYREDSIFIKSDQNNGYFT